VKAKQEEIIETTIKDGKLSQELRKITKFKAWKVRKKNILH
jgi:hypothetical protein